VNIMSDEITNSSTSDTVIIDIGEALTKVGFAGEEKPRAIFPTVIGKPKYQTMAGVQAQELYVGDDTSRMRGVLKLSYPISRGAVMDWNNYFAILNYIFYNVLRVEPKNINIIYLIPPLIPNETAEYFARVLFETHECKKVALIDSATTAVFSVGHTTGLSIEMGEGLSTITPVMDGQIYVPSIQRLNLAGIDIEEYLAKLLSQYGIFQKKEIIKDIKEKALKIALDPEKGIEDPKNEFDFLLPDGEKLKINPYIACMAPEILFSPEIISTNVASLPQGIINSLRAVNPAYLRPLLKNIVLSGGTSYIPGLEERLVQEINKLISQLGELPPEEEEEEPSHEDEQNVPIQVPQLKKKVENCPKCGELVDLQTHLFCPKCHAKLTLDQIKILDDEKIRLSRKEKKFIKQTAMGTDDFTKIAGDVASEYGDEEDFAELLEIEGVVGGEMKQQQDSHGKIVHFLLDSERHCAAYKGASILGVLPSFLNAMIDHEEFLVNPEKAIIKFSDIIQI
jgi:actin beta/gamma 1